MTERAVRFPDFLIIGAMKCGTTTLFKDLCAHPRVFMPENKEPHNLCKDDVLTEAGLAAYAALFAPARADQVCGEASTGYSKLPSRPGVVERARRMLTDDLRILYIVREPVSRIVSHHFHVYSNGRVGPDIGAAVRADPRFLDYTRYAMQAQPWLDAYGPERVRIVRFETFITARREHAASLHGFLGVEPRPDLIDEGRAHNTGEGKPVPRKLSKFLRSPLYKKAVRGVTPPALRRWVVKTALPRAPERPPPPTPETVEFILGSLADDMERLRVILGLPGPVWDGAATRARWAGSGAGELARAEDEEAGETARRGGGSAEE